MIIVHAGFGWNTEKALECATATLDRQSVRILMCVICLNTYSVMIEFYGIFYEKISLHV